MATKKRTSDLKPGSTRDYPIDQLKPYPGNPRRGDIDEIATSLEINGQYKPIVVNCRNHQVLAGNHTREAAIKLGWKKIKIHVVDATPAQARRIVLVDNRTNDVAGYDNDDLAKVLEQMDGDLTGTGYDEAAVNAVLAELEDEPTAGKTDVDDLPETITVTVLPDQVWQLGDHRLICGNATAPETLAKLMGDERAHLVWTDPPYNVAYEGGSKPREEIANDSLPDDTFRALLRESFTLALEYTVPGGPLYVPHADMERIAFEEEVRQAGWRYAQTLVWVKDRGTFGRQDYFWQHEPIIYAWKPGKAHRWFGGYDKTTVENGEADPKDLDKKQLATLVNDLRNELNSTIERHPKPQRSDLHPTTKPVKLVQRHVRNSSTRGDVVLDPFGGSGSTLIACETLGRACRMVELEAENCGQIITRWQEFTGRRAQAL